MEIKTNEGKCPCKGGGSQGKQGEGKKKKEVQKKRKRSPLRVL